MSCGIISGGAQGCLSRAKTPVVEHKIASAVKGTYALLIALGKKTPIAVGRLGLFTFSPGYYLYVGSAQSGLYPRVKRHLKREKKLRWHIDYLLNFAQVVEVWYATGVESQECFWCQIAHEMPQSEIPAKGFGSSDCRCASHLIYFTRLPSFALFLEKLGERGWPLKRVTPAEFLG